MERSYGLEVSLGSLASIHPSIYLAGWFFLYKNWELLEVEDWFIFKILAPLLPLSLTLKISYLPSPTYFILAHLNSYFQINFESLSSLSLAFIAGIAHLLHLFLLLLLLLLLLGFCFLNLSSFERFPSSSSSSRSLDVESEEVCCNGKKKSWCEQANGERMRKSGKNKITVLEVHQYAPKIRNK